MGREWIKLYVDKWLDGTMSLELSDTQYGIWSKFLALAERYNREGNRLGEIPLPLEAIRRIFGSKTNAFASAVDKFVETGRIELTDKGVFILNFRIYNPSRLDIHRDKMKHGETLGNGVKRCETKEEEGEEELELDNTSSIEGQVEEIRASDWYVGFKKEYPHFKDTDLEAAAQWLEEDNAKHPRRQPRSVSKRFLINWAKRGQDGKGSSKSARVPDKYERPDEL